MWRGFMWESRDRARTAHEVSDLRLDDENGSYVEPWNCGTQFQPSARQDELKQADGGSR